jgi:uncharacterized membrane protein
MNYGPIGIAAGLAVGSLIGLLGSLVGIAVGAVTRQCQSHFVRYGTTA